MTTKHSRKRRTKSQKCKLATRRRKALIAKLDARISGEPSEPIELGYSPNLNQSFRLKARKQGLAPLATQLMNSKLDNLK